MIILYKRYFSWASPPSGEDPRYVTSREEVILGVRPKDGPPGRDMLYERVPRVSYISADYQKIAGTRSL
jgi:hypothetical protein